MKRFLTLTLAVLAGLSLAMTPASTAATVPTYADYAMSGIRSAGQYWSGTQVAGQWSWSPQNTTESRISWGDPAKWPPTYNEQFVTVGEWVTLPGWFDNGTFYKVQTTTEWQAAADCRTGRVSLPTGGPQHYVRSTIPVAAYCLYAEGTITEQSSGKVMHFQHQQVWSPAKACGTNAYGLTGPGCVDQWESWSDDIGTPFALKLERTATLARGLGMAFRIRQTYPSVWAADLRYAWRW
jgi:hypothetical protein